MLKLVALVIPLGLDTFAISAALGIAPGVLAVALIATQAFLVAQLGFRIGSRVSEAVREGAERLAGAVLILLGAGFAAARLFGIQA